MPKLSEINHQSDEFMRSVATFYRKPTGFFLMAGTNGTGKTFAAKALYEHFLPRIESAHFYSQSMLNMKWLGDTKHWGDALYLLEQLSTAKLLVLDDVGSRPPSDAFMDFLYAVSDQRFESRDTLGTIITTNLNANSMRIMFGDAFVSRVASGICIRNDGCDRRFKEF